MAPIRTATSKANSESRVPPTGYNFKRVIKGDVVGAKFRSDYDGVHDESQPYRYPMSLPLGRRKPPPDPRGLRLTLKDLEFVGALGKGISGQVILVRPREQDGESPQLFALKAIRKKHLRDQERTYYNEMNHERIALASMDWNPFVTGILDTFYDARNLYLMLEYGPCGSFERLVCGRPKDAPLLSLAQTLFYFANIVCGLEHIHKSGFVNRDLKPTNILIGMDGYLTLCDFGLADFTPTEEEAVPHWKGTGTVGYQAPETIALDGQPPGFRYGPALDWWAAGTILYLMTTGVEPFSTDVVEEDAVVLKRTLKGSLTWPPEVRVGLKLKTLVQGLLTVNADERMGLRDVMQHPWLATVDWTKMRRKQYLPPSLGVPVARAINVFKDKPLKPKHYPGLHFAA